MLELRLSSQPMKRPRSDRDFCALLASAAVAQRQSGSHRTFTMADGNIVTVPCHNGDLKDCSPKVYHRLTKLCLRYGLLTTLALIAAALWVLA